jgi:DNA polymerase-3 subunit gamma/tau
MSYQVIARRFRPQTFNEIVYQDHITNTLQNSIKNGRISHAYLFTGTRGVGKTTTARVLAKSLNCVKGPTPEPCGVCENCVEIKAGNSFDVFEIDGASNNGVENIRDLRETIHFAPVKSNYKIYIIDEVHMLSTSAFNALLKTLEEPPPHAVFIFATTEYYKVPETIISRCQKFFFKKITTDVIVSHLSDIVKSEKIEVDDSILYSIARNATGSMRDAQSLLEQILSFAQNGHVDNSAAALLGIVPLEIHKNILTAIRENQLNLLIEQVQNLSDYGTDVSRFLGTFIQTIRIVRMLHNGIIVDSTSGYSEDELLSLKQIASIFADEELSAIFAIASELSSKLRSTEFESVYLEMALLDMAALCRRPSISALIKKLESQSDNPVITAEKKKE